jgi:hypothetical protein
MFQIIRFRASDSMYEIQLPYGVGFIRHSSIIGAEELSPLARQAVGVSGTEAGATIHNGAVSSNKSQPLVHEPNKLFFGTQMCYLFLRLHHIIFVRLTTARQLAGSESKKEWSNHPLADMDAPSDNDDQVRSFLYVQFSDSCVMLA